MRELLFRGQTRKRGEKVHAITGEKLPGQWVYGGVFQGPAYSVIYGYDNFEKHVVYSDTVSQFTGILDVNGNKIFEGDTKAGAAARRRNRYHCKGWRGTKAAYAISANPDRG